MNFNTTIPYEDYKKLVADASVKDTIISLINTKFKDAECQLTAIKAVLGIIEEEETPVEEPNENPEGEPQA